MPELPDILVYQQALRRELRGQRLLTFQVVSPFLLRTVEPGPEEFEGLALVDVLRVGKRVVLAFEREHLAVFHLMIAGRFKLSAAAARRPGRGVLAALRFERHTLTLIEAGSKRRAALHLLDETGQLAGLDAGGIDVRRASLEAFSQRLRGENRTLKRRLTDPHVFDGIGNAYSDEILHAAKLSPIRLTRSLTDDEVARLLAACQAVLAIWSERLLEEFADRFPAPSDITAFRPGFAVHGRFGEPCPVCGTRVQRIVRADNEVNYCPGCQTDGRVLADRSLSRLLKDDWPRTAAEWEAG